MAILSLPATDQFRQARFGLIPNTLAFRSSLNKSTDTVEFPGQLWSLDVAISPRTREEARGWHRFLDLLHGRAGRFYAGDPDGVTPLGSPGTSAPQVNGADQVGRQLVTDGWDPSGFSLLKYGDYVSFDIPDGTRSLHRLTENVDSDAGGNATLTFEPPMRLSPADDEVVTIAGATCVMMLIDDNQGITDRNTARFYSLGFAAIEAYTLGS